jgi:hypothetical protein
MLVAVADEKEGEKADQQRAEAPPILDIRVPPPADPTENMPPRINPALWRYSDERAEQGIADTPPIVAATSKTRANRRHAASQASWRFC